MLLFVFNFLFIFLFTSCFIFPQGTGIMRHLIENDLTDSPPSQQMQQDINYLTVTYHMSMLVLEHYFRWSNYFWFLVFFFRCRFSLYITLSCASFKPSDYVVA